MVACLFGLTAVFTFAEMHVMKTVIRNADLKKDEWEFSENYATTRHCM